MVVNAARCASARPAELPVKNFPVARQSEPSPPEAVNYQVSAINLKNIL